MFVTMVIAALIVDGLFSALGLIPTGPRPTRADIFGPIQRRLQARAQRARRRRSSPRLFWLTARRGATDPVCGMKVDRAKAVTQGVRRPDATTSARSTACTRSKRTPRST